MNTDSRDRESVTESKGAGWKWIPQQGVYLWWDGERYTSRAERVGAEWRLGPLAEPKRRPPPPRWRVVTMLTLASLVLALTLAVSVWSFQDINEGCRRDSPADVSQCVDESDETTLMFAVFGIGVAVGCVALSGVHRSGR